MRIDNRLIPTGPRILAFTLSLVSLASIGCGSGGTPAAAPVTPTAATPTFTPAAGSYTSDQTITIADTTAGATIHYSLNGAAEQTYSTGIPISTTSTVTAYATATGYDQSATASATYTLNLPPEPTPTFSPSAGTYSSIQTVTISDADTVNNPAIYYTTDGSTPMVGVGTTALYTTPITVATTETVSAIAIGVATNSYSNSAVGSALYTINLPAAPICTFMPAGGTYSTVQSVTLSDTANGATIYYTVDGTVPTAASTVYTAPLTIAATTTVNCIATASGYSTSPEGSALYTINFLADATPTFSPSAGTYSSVQTVSILDSVPGSTIYYAINSTPTTGSIRYTGPITVSTSETVEAIAVATDYTQSAVGSAAYTINLPPTNAPTFSPAGGTYTSTQTVTISDSTPGASIYYTTNGLAASTSSTPYMGAIQVASTTTINAVAISSPNNSVSPDASATYTINLPTAATCTFSPVAGTYTSAQTVSILDGTAGTTIHYTTDGSMPTASSTVYSSPLNVSSTETINAIAVETGYNNSPMCSATFTINLPTAATPTFSPVAGTYTSDQSVVISDATPGATIYYTTNGSMPTTSSTKYTGAISVTTSETIEAIAVLTGYNNSPVGSAAYVINIPVVATCTFSPVGGTYTTIQTVSLLDSTSGATIYYTTNGNTPTTSSTVYSAPLTVSTSETIQCLATAPGDTNSAIGSAAYVINLPTAATPTFTPGTGSYTTAQSVVISDSTSGAIVYYTTDGSTPTTGSNVYSTPITVSSTETIKAIAAATGYLNSTMGFATYTFGPTVVSVVETNQAGTLLMTAQSSVNFGTSAVASDQIVVDETQTFQTMDGFGAAFTETAAYVMEENATHSQLTATLNNLFTRTGTGIGLSFMRLPMGASDLSLSQYTYDDMPSGQTDVNLANFSIAHDETNIIPFIQSALALNPSLKIMANPWSPPAWMKTPVTLDGGYLNTTYATPWANYFVKFVQAYENVGIPITYLSIQNEPLYETSNYPGMYITDSSGGAYLSATQLLTTYMLPALSAATFPLTTPQIFLYDHNWDTQSYPETELESSTIAQSPLVAGTAWHGYAGTPGAQGPVANIEAGLNPALGTWETEHGATTGSTFGAQLTLDMLEITQVVRNAGKGYLKWTLATNQNQGPNLTTQNQGGGCAICTGLVTVNSSTGVVTNNEDFYSIGHFSKYVLQGAKRIYSSNGIYTSSAAFLNPDGSKALVVFNNSTSAQTVQVQWGTQNFSYSLPGNAAATFTWTGTQSGTSNITATNETQTSDYVTMSGIETEYSGDTTGAYDVGYLVNDAELVYNNVNFGATSPTKMIVRTSSGGAGGTLTVHLDSLTGATVATVALPSGSSYTSYQNVAATLAQPVTGVHNLYFVITQNSSSSGIANLNWFIFQ